MICLTVLAQYRHVTDGRTDRIATVKRYRARAAFRSRSIRVEILPLFASFGESLTMIVFAAPDNFAL